MPIVLSQAMTFLGQLKPTNRFRRARVFNEPELTPRELPRGKTTGLTEIILGALPWGYIVLLTANSISAAPL